MAGDIARNWLLTNIGLVFNKENHYGILLRQLSKASVYAAGTI